MTLGISLHKNFVIPFIFKFTKILTYNLKLGLVDKLQLNPTLLHKSLSRHDHLLPFPYY